MLDSSRKTIMKVVKLLLALTASLTLSACVKGPSDPLLESPIGHRLACESTKPMLAHDQLSRLPLQCQTMNLSTTLHELRQAGWRLENVSIGEDQLIENNRAVALSLTLRKIY